MLEASNINYSVGGKRIISDLSVSFEPGRLNLIIGPNGAGKSTLVKLLSGFLRAQEGRVEYDGTDIFAVRTTDIARRRAVLSQAVEIAFPLSVREVVMMGRYPHFGGHPGAADEQIVEDMLRFFDIVDFRERNYQTLSGGERQRVNFARVLGQLWRPASDNELPMPFPARYLFLDEPLTFLDIRHQIDFMEKIRTFAAQPDVVTVGVVHDLNLAVRFGDQLIVLDDGRLLARGTPREVLTPELIHQVFRVRSRFVDVEGAAPHLVLG